MNAEKIEKKRKRNLIFPFQTTKSGFLRFIVFTILWTFKNFVIRPEALVLYHNIKKFANLWHLWGSVYEAKLIMYRSSHPEVFCKKVFLENLQNSQKNTYARVSFIIKLQSSTLYLYSKRHSGKGVLKNTFLIEHLRATASKYNVTFKEFLSLIEL